MSKFPRLQRMAYRLQCRLLPHALILIYHRVADLFSDPQLLAVNPERFADHLEIIRKYGFPVSLSELVDALKEGKVLNRAVVLTFDDGYADNLYHAMPLLERYDITATVFITTDSLSSTKEFWWDELERVLLQPGILPEQLRLAVNGTEKVWDTTEASYYLEEAYLRFRSWHVECPDNPSKRHHLYRSLYDWLLPFSENDRQKALESLATWAGIPAIGRLSHRPLTTDELLQLASSNMIEIGAHTMTHPVLSLLSMEQQRYEIRQSKERLEAIINRPVTSFAIPYGASNPETFAILREADFNCACTSVPKPVWPGADRFRLPRLVARDWDGDNFSRWLRQWLDGQYEV